MKINILSRDLIKKLRVILKKINYNTKTEKIIYQLYDLATHDEKTKLYNIRFFNNIFEIELEKAKRGEKLSLAIFDIDNFKQINSMLGHIKADKILVKIASIIKSSLRKSDIIARFGGEEFIVLLPSTSLDKAKKVCERIRKEVEKNFSSPITISIGVTEYKKQDTQNLLKNRADKALFKAKEKGRNRVELAKLFF